MKKKSRQTIKSALIRGLDELKEGLDSINTISADIKKKPSIPKADGSSFKIAGNPAKRTRNANKSVLGEMDRFTQILSNNTFKNSPIETIQKHLSNSL
ncbi:hypothetical protein AYI69_g3454 [Smittium culicis]|uniref:Ribosome biogenesis protein SLX9 n=1 Tax=Smittium culicis TaxID=133412 RepID=A0A1R1YJP7_9FUNG|nr:hypothetical protein AYI69_g3454 [Smittium culicis]